MLAKDILVFKGNRFFHLLNPPKAEKILRLSSVTWGDQENVLSILIPKFNTLTLGSKQISSSETDGGGLGNLNSCLEFPKIHS